MPLYSGHPAAAAAPSPSPHSNNAGYVSCGTATSAAGTGICAPNSTSFSGAYGGSGRQTGYGTNLQPHAVTSALAQPFQQFTPPGGATNLNQAVTVQQHRVAGGTFASVPSPQQSMISHAPSSPNEVTSQIHRCVAVEPQNSANIMDVAFQASSQQTVQGTAAIQSSNIEVVSGIAGQSTTNSATATSGSVVYNQDDLVNPIEVAHSFAFQYYHILHDKPSELHKFYDLDGRMNRSTDCECPNMELSGSSMGSVDDARVVGQQEIYKVFQRCGFDRTTCRIRFIDGQKVRGGGIMVLVTGYVKHAEGKPEREFVQTVFLLKQLLPRPGYYVCNEMLCYLDTFAEDVMAATVEGESKLISQTLLMPSSPSSAPNSNNYETVDPCLEIPIINSVTSPKSLSLSVRSPRVSLNNNQLLIGSDPVGSTKEVATQATTTKVERSTANLGKQLDCVIQRKEKEDVQCANSKEGEEVTNNVLGKVHHWNKQEIKDAEPEISSNWPKPGENLAKSTTNEQRNVEMPWSVPHNYDPESFAFKVVQNGTKPVGQMGFALPGDHRFHQTTEPISCGYETDRDGKRRHSPTARPIENSVQQKKLLVISGIPQQMSDEEIRRAVADRLQRYNEGQVIEVRRLSGGGRTGVTIELDCRQSAEYLMENGLYIRGRYVRIDFPRSNNRGGMGRGGGGGRGGYGNRGTVSAARGGRRYGYDRLSEPRGDQVQTIEGGDQEGQWIDAGKRKNRGRGGGGPFVSVARGRGGPAYRGLKKTENDGSY